MNFKQKQQIFKLYCGGLGLSATTVIKECEKIIEIVKSAENNNGQMNIDANNADAFVEAIAGSDNMMNILQKASEIEGDKLAGMTAGIDENSSNNIKASAEKSL